MSGISDLTESLEIVQNANRISLGSGEFDPIDNDYDNRDILEYSKDDVSINFVVEDQPQEIPFQTVLNFKEQPQQKKRRDIFGKYKKKTQQQVRESVRNSGGFMKTFDQVFHLGEFSSKIKQQQNFDKKKLPQQGQISSSENSDSIIIQQNRDTICIDRASLLNNSDIKITDESWNRFSAIRENGASNETHEEQDIQQLLKIIEQDKQATPKKEISKPQEHYQAPQITKKNQIIITKQENIEIVHNDNEKQRRQLGTSNSLSNQNSSTQIYNQIDITQSMPNSTMIRDPLDISDNKRILSPSGSKNNMELTSLGQQSKPRRSIPALMNKAIFPMSKVQENQSYPLFLRQVSAINQSFPNFNFPGFDPNLPQHKQQIMYLVQALKNVLIFIGKISKQIIQKCGKIKQHLQIFKQGYKLDHFLNSGWQNTIEIEQIEKIRPKRPFSIRTFDDVKISKALQNYKQIVEYYKNPSLKLATEEGRKKYISLRNKLWDIQKNILLISEDLYSETLRYFYPLHYHQFLYFLRSKFPKSYSKNIIEQRKYLLAKYLHMKNRNDPLSCSQVGSEVRKKLETELKYLCPI